MSSTEVEKKSLFASPPSKHLPSTDPISPPAPSPSRAPTHVTSEGESPSRKRTHTEMAGNQGNDDTKDGTVRPASRSDRSGTPTPGPRLSSPMIQDSDSDSQNVTSVKPNQQNVNDEEEEEQSDPTEELAEFDWTDLQERYHDAMKKLQAEETQIGIEFTDLMKFFELWAQTTAAHEVDRSFTRLMTRSAHVRISEAQLEEKRQHYMKVVNAFQSALNLLNAP